MSERAKHKASVLKWKDAVFVLYILSFADVRRTSASSRSEREHSIVF